MATKRAQRKPAAKRPARKAAPAPAEPHVPPRAPAQPDDPHGLSPQERLFVDAYVECWNGAEAARRAGFSPESAKQRAHELGRRVGVRMAIDATCTELREAGEVTREGLVRELRAIAFARVDQVATWDGFGLTLKPPGEIPPDAMAAVESITYQFGAQGLKTGVKLHSKLDAIGRLAKLLDLEPKETRPGEGAGVQIILAGGPTGLEVNVAPGAAVTVAEAPAEAKPRAWKPKAGGVAAAAKKALATLAKENA